MPGTLVSKSAASELLQLFVDERKQLVESGVTLASRRPLEEARDRLRRGSSVWS
jgi:hypothetical protein